MVGGWTDPASPKALAGDALRPLAVWLLILLVETIHGLARTVFLTPRLGDFRARQVSVFTASVLILAITAVFLSVASPGQRSFLSLPLSLRGRMHCRPT
jgi:hypothetical protein